MDEIVNGFAKEGIAVIFAAEQIVTINAETAARGDVIGGLGLIESLQSAADWMQEVWIVPSRD